MYVRLYAVIDKRGNEESISVREGIFHNRTHFLELLNYWQSQSFQYKEVSKRNYHKFKNVHKLDHRHEYPIDR